MRALAVVLALLVAPLVAMPVHAAVKVPAGNRNAEQPPIPGGSKKRTRQLRTTFDAKYRRIRDLIASDAKLKRKIKVSARTFGIDPIHIVGALVGEHTYNVDAKDRLQTYYVKAMAYLRQDMSFRYKGERVTRFVKRPEFRVCRSARGSYALWSCRERVWEQEFMGRRGFPATSFGRTFFQPFYAGQTFGLGQLNPLTALKVNDLVRSRYRRARRLKASQAGAVYQAIMDPDVTLMTMAAVIRNAIDVYAREGGYDISGNPGITATLYNLGKVEDRARAARKRGRMPQENYYGWLVNDRIDDLRAALR